MRTKYRYTLKTTCVFFITILTLFLGFSCKGPKQLENEMIKTMPSAYAEVKDSSSAGDLNWKNYFTDEQLVSLIETGIKNNADLKIAHQKLEAAQANVRFSKNSMLPNLNANVTAAQRKYGLYTMDGAGNISTYMLPGRIVPIHLPDYYLGLTTSWEIDVWGKLRNKKKAAYANYLSSNEGKNLIITNLIADIANCYYELIALDIELDILSETTFLQEKALELAKSLKETGNGNELEVQQFQAQVLNSKGLEYELKQRIIILENRINFFLNRYPQKVERNKSVFNSESLPITKSGIPSQLLSNRPDIRKAEFDLVASRANLMAAKAAFYPSLAISAGIGYQAFDTRFLFTSPQSLAYSLAGGLVAPLINRNAIKTEFKITSAQQNEALYNYQKSILNGFYEVSNELKNIENLQSAHSLKSMEVEALEKASNISTDLFKSGRANYLDVLFTQRGTLQAKIELVTLRKQQYNAHVNLYKALGGGWK